MEVTLIVLQLGLRDTLTWDALYYMVDDAILEYLGMKETHYGETAGNEPAKLPMRRTDNNLRWLN